MSSEIKNIIITFIGASIGWFTSIEYALAFFVGWGCGVLTTIMLVLIHKRQRRAYEQG